MIIYLLLLKKRNYYNYNMLLLLPILLLVKNLNDYSYTMLLLLNEGFIQGSFLQKKKEKGFTSILSMEVMEQHKQHLIISSSITFLILSFNFLPLLPMSS